LSIKRQGKSPEFVPADVHNFATLTYRLIDSALYSAREYNRKRMCGRFTLTERDGKLVEARLGLTDGALAAIGGYAPRYNLAPTQDHFVLVTNYENRAAMRARWGLVPYWSSDTSRASQAINAKSETIDSTRTFREAFQKRRCVVPADGFYEWTGPRTARQPMWIKRRDGQLLLFAGLYEQWKPAVGDMLTTFTILTCAANTTMTPVHNRMPVILSDRDADDWMNPREANPLALKRMLVPAPENLLEMRPVSPLVNDVRNEGAELLTEPIQRSLF
jgi:putative SOS response-associated peptidase YedK